MGSPSCGVGLVKDNEARELARGGLDAEHVGGASSALQLSTEFVQQCKTICAGGIRIVYRVALRRTGHFFAFHDFVELIAPPEFHI